MTGQYLKAEDVAAELGVGVDWVRRQCKAGVIPAKKLGHEWRILRANLDAFMGAPDATPPAQPGRALSARQRRRAS